MLKIFHQHNFYASGAKTCNLVSEGKNYPRILIFLIFLLNFLKFVSWFIKELSILQKQMFIYWICTDVRTVCGPYLHNNFEVLETDMPILGTIQRNTVLYSKTFVQAWTIKKFWIPVHFPEQVIFYCCRTHDTQVFHILEKVFKINTYGFFFSR